MIRSIEDLVEGKRYRFYYEDGNTLTRLNAKFKAITRDGKELVIVVKSATNDFLVPWKSVRHIDSC